MAATASIALTEDLRFRLGVGEVVEEQRIRVWWVSRAGLLSDRYLMWKTP